MTSKTTLSIPEGYKPIPSTEPSLMPFHIAYSGPAPISTYFLEKPFTPGDHRSTSIQKAAKEGSSKSLDPFNGSQTKVEETTDEKNSDAQQNPAQDKNEMFSAAFRGRRVIGQFVRVPEGFTGVILTGTGTPTVLQPNVNTKASVSKPAADTSKSTGRAAALKAKAAAKLKAKGKQLSLDDPADESQPPEDESRQEIPNEEKILSNNDNISRRNSVDERAFEITAKFQSFKLWNPDVPVDEGSDEYIRSLQEWMVLSSEVCVSI
ncbi:1045_t:CDS:1 [Acaulospora colombiana]|uniref:1045_t:CDS:1 n=1 Tax=Acaulospora colombiana TaxID=27376 RepID=A0ACA9MCL4_9GLOM|nr:1045_t:CDS:1 [Acaulospora colombiana]